MSLNSRYLLLLAQIAYFDPEVHDIQKIVDMFFPASHGPTFKVKVLEPNMTRHGRAEVLYCAGFVFLNSHYPRTVSETLLLDLLHIPTSTPRFQTTKCTRAVLAIVLVCLVYNSPRLSI